MASSIFICCLFFLALSSSSMVNAHKSSSLKVGFYASTCPKAETIVRNVVNKAISKNPGLGAGLLRMHFHDCFVRGCDASILLDSTSKNKAEKDNPANYPSLRGFEVLDEAKSQLEAQCPETVSCADIIAFAARDSALKLGGINYAVKAGRRDGRISRTEDAEKNLPPFTYNVQQLQQRFDEKGLSLEEMVVLSGAHSVGISHCSSFSDRLYSFNATTKQDPSIDPKFAEELKKKCPKNNPTSDPTVPFDYVTPYKLDNKYYQDLENHQGILYSDQTLVTSPKTAELVKHFARQGEHWAKKFAKAMVRMGSIEVLTGDEGEIRKNCRFIN